jgi:hypothetical protein
MARNAIQKQVDEYLPMLSARQQVLVLEMIKSFLNVDAESERLSSSQYNKEIDTAVARVEEGLSISHSDALDALSEW